MKKLNIFYWVVTVIFAGFMIFSAVPDVLKSPDAVKIITGLGYPVYLMPFLGIAKILGSIAILLPRFNRLKEWAYAGLFFDLLGALYSAIQVGGWDIQLSVMILIIGVLFLSYFLWHKKARLEGTNLN